jgi:hypothetical protein
MLHCNIPDIFLTLKFKFFGTLGNLVYVFRVKLYFRQKSTCDVTHVTYKGIINIISRINDLEKSQYKSTNC